MKTPYIEIVGTDVKLELSKVVSVDIEKEMINLEKLPNGTWRLIFSKSLIPDITKVTGFDIIREE